MRAFKSSALGESGICSTRHSRPLHRHGFTLSLLLKPRSSEEPAGDGRCQDSRPKGIPLLSFCPQLSISETQTFSPSLIPASLGCCTQDKVPGPDMWKEHDALKPRPAPSLGLPAVAGRRAEARETPPTPTHSLANRGRAQLLALRWAQQISLSFGIISLSSSSFVWVEKVVHRDLCTNPPQRQRPCYVK